MAASPNVEKEIVAEEELEHLSSFDMFVLALSVFCLVNIILELLPLNQEVTNVVVIMDIAVSVVFMADFIMRMRRAEDKSTYFFRKYGWIDFLGSLPFPYLRLARVFRVVRAYKPIRRLGIGGIFKTLAADRAGSALIVAAFLVIVTLQYAGMLVLIAERSSSEANITNGSDAVWWAYVTVTTVGYGDKFPVTNAGRLVGVLLMGIGVGLFGVITGFLANAFLAPKKKEAPASPEPAPDAVAAQTQSDSPTAAVADVAPLDIQERLRQLEDLIVALRRDTGNGETETTGPVSPVVGSTAREVTS